MKMVGVNSSFNVQASHTLIFISLSHICHLARGSSRAVSLFLELELCVISVAPGGPSCRGSGSSQFLRHLCKPPTLHYKGSLDWQCFEWWYKSIICTRLAILNQLYIRRHWMKRQLNFCQNFSYAVANPINLISPWNAFGVRSLMVSLYSQW